MLQGNLRSTNIPSRGSTNTLSRFIQKPEISAGTNGLLARPITIGTDFILPLKFPGWLRYILWMTHLPTHREYVFNNNNKKTSRVYHREFILFFIQLWFSWTCLDFINPLTPRVKYIGSFLTFDSMDRTLKCDHSLESCWAVLYYFTLLYFGHGTVRSAKGLMVADISDIMVSWYRLYCYEAKVLRIILQNTRRKLRNLYFTSVSASPGFRLLRSKRSTSAQTFLKATTWRIQEKAHTFFNTWQYVMYRSAERAQW